ncbi:hypothetical protein W97_03706 [Coniosporium apollinis CBS 100218]|uniref:Uncharacterized protein n=1 Tax=Coniosporium apollinis (strain CBS 100218) TaxID=1168221 RepID=R7YRN2_CONA1|nr:uncharacterized protein W97_03706 [Coniosporium apollinis CBS 100218]EON64474.1 hypothetical protein W97_03706 [Coniosporium apollinis CBS 100218]
MRGPSLVPYSDSEPASPQADNNVHNSAAQQIFQEQSPLKPLLKSLPQRRVHQSPQPTVQPEQQLDERQPQPTPDEVTSWITRYWDLTHPLLESNPAAPTSPEVLLHYASRPPALTIAQSLQLHLDSLVAESDQRDNLQHRITTHLYDEDLSGRVNIELNRQMRVAGFTPPQILSSGQEAVQKVRHIRNHAAMQRARDLVTGTTDRDLDFSVVAILQRDGAVLASDLVHCSVSSSTCWAEFQRYLAAASVSWQAELNGFPAGCGSENGGWMYLVQPPPDPVGLQQFRQLGSEADFTVLKAVVAAGGEVQVWHHLTVAQSGALKAEWDFLVHRVVEPADEPRNEEGYSYFWPWFDAYDVLRVPDEVFNAQCLRGSC